MQKILLVRQALFNSNLDVVGYELLFRHESASQMSPELFFDVLSEKEIKSLIEKKQVLVRFTPELIKQRIPAVIPRPQLTIGIDKTVIEDEVLKEKILIHRNEGYKIAVCNVNAVTDDVLQVADIVSFDATAVNEESLASIIEICQKEERQTLVTGVDEYQIYEKMKSMGVTRFEGEFFSRPNVVEGKRLSSNKMVLTRLLCELQDPNTSPGKLEEILGHDMTLSYKLLKIINSASFGSLRKIESLKEAVIRLGFDTVRNWASLISLSSIDDKPHELMFESMQKAKMCQLIAELLEADCTSVYFTVGLFSNLDAMLDQELQVLLEDVPLTQEIKNALLYHEGDLGKVLYHVNSYIHANWDRVDCNRLTADQYRECYMASLEWSKDTCDRLYG